MTNKIRELLCNLGLSDDSSIMPFYPKVRDRDDISVLKCHRSGVLFLSADDHMNLSHYSEQDSFSYWGMEDRKKSTLLVREDSIRRFNRFSNLGTNKKLLDVGAGNGAMLDLFAPVADSVTGVEPQSNVRDQLISEGYSVYKSIDDLSDEEHFDLITLFHVFEHMTDPIESLIKLKSKMEKDGKIIIEVPHANDFLISFFDLEEFKKFTFWSEHLILHTRDSLKVFLQEAGFTNINILSCQRYPLANHFYWLHNKKPGGHQKWDHLRNDQIDEAYSALLSQLDCTDTLIAVASA